MDGWTANLEIRAPFVMMLNTPGARMFKEDRMAGPVPARPSTRGQFGANQQSGMGMSSDSRHPLIGQINGDSSCFSKAHLRKIRRTKRSVMFEVARCGAAIARSDIGLRGGFSVKAEFHF